MIDRSGRTALLCMSVSLPFAVELVKVFFSPPTVRGLYDDSRRSPQHPDAERSGAGATDDANETPALRHAVPGPPPGPELWSAHRPAQAGHRLTLAEPRRGARPYSADRERGNPGPALHSEAHTPAGGPRGPASRGGARRTRWARPLEAGLSCDAGQTAAQRGHK